MEHILNTFLIALSNNFDNIGARVAYSMRGIRISTPINLWISVITFVISALSAYSGTVVSDVLPKNTTPIIAMVLLTAIGSWMILEQYVKNEDDGEEIVKKQCRAGKASVLEVFSEPEKADVDGSKHIDFREATILGLALSINNVGGGLSAGMIGLNAIMIGLLSAVINFVALWSGNYIAAFFTRWNLNKKATFAAGILLIALGIRQII
ncbi:MAG: sporulation membrane protein YtaF [Deltaproteobacteria bacterium]|nr:sporulation membrane protein YtaF [Deltaproteobacteria bacterium]